MQKTIEKKKLVEPMAEQGPAELSPRNVWNDVFFCLAAIILFGVIEVIVVLCLKQAGFIPFKKYESCCEELINCSIHQPQAATEKVANIGV